MFLQRAHERLRVGYSGCLEVLEGPQVALALFALQLQERDGGAQGDGIWVLALRYGDGRRLRSEGGRGRRGRAGSGFGALHRS